MIGCHLPGRDSPSRRRRATNTRRRRATRAFSSSCGSRQSGRMRAVRDLMCGPRATSTNVIPAPRGPEGPERDWAGTHALFSLLSYCTRRRRLRGSRTMQNSIRELALRCMGPGRFPLVRGAVERRRDDARRAIYRPPGGCMRRCSGPDQPGSALAGAEGAPPGTRGVVGVGETAAKASGA